LNILKICILEFYLVYYTKNIYKIDVTSHRIFMVNVIIILFIIIVIVVVVVIVLNIIIIIIIIIITVLLYDIFLHE
jgi:hypothetical protein